MAQHDTPTPTLTDQSRPAVPIVAIGASAGGIEAVTELFHNLSPTTGLAFVYVQHLNPDEQSALPTILGRATTMPVREAEHMMRVEANNVYVVPSDHDLEVIDGALTLVLRQRRPVPHMPVDQFFLSLAERQREGAIAVLLSGVDSDGTQGMRAIKAAGGFTFAQDATAQFQSMPTSAIAEGVVDQVLPPAEIARELERLSRQPDILRQTSLADDDEDEAEKTDVADLKPIIQILRKSVGVDFSHYKLTTIRRRIIRRMLLTKLESLNEYAVYLRQHPAEVTALYNDLLINVTTFFRDVGTMNFLRKVLLPRLVNEKSVREPLRVWVPACSTGQEAYSLAMLLLEVMEERGLSLTIQIFATDLSDQAISKARVGVYNRSEVLDVSSQRLNRFFTKTDDQYRISKIIRDLCVFAPHNIFRDPPFSRVDLISCRNLLIYLDPVLQRKALSTFHYALNPTGYLVLGKSETVGNANTLFAQIEKSHKVFVRRNDVASRAVFDMNLHGGGFAAPPTTNATQQRTDLETGRATLGAAASSKSSGAFGDLEKLVDQLLLSRYVPASVVVNTDLDILQFRGSTGLFLEPAPGKASLNLLRMARPSLTFELRNAVNKVQRSGEPFRKQGLEVKVGDTIHYVAIEAAPINTGSDERLFLITFQETFPAVVSENDPRGAQNRRIRELEEELASVRRDMHSVIEEQEASNEELQSANEEIVSSNEELQSINEELETSKEEIESSNEELLTINQELQVRNEQLSEAYEFAEDVFATLREATMVLDESLRVRSANKTFYSLFQVNEENTVGRLIYELGNRQWDIPQLRLLLTDVITRNVQVDGFEVTHTFELIGEKVLLVNARRVIRQQESILLAIEDITEHRRAQRLLKEREAYFRNIADNAPTLIWVADSDGRPTYVNKRWLDYTGQSLADVMASGWLQTLHPDDRPGYQAMYDARFRDRQPFSAEYRLRRHDGDYRWLLEQAQPTFGQDGTFSGFFGSSAGIHLQRELSQELDRLVSEHATELTSTNARLAASNDTIQQMLNGSIAAICLLEAVRDEAGTIVDFQFLGANKASEQINGKTEAGLLGKRLLEVFPRVDEAVVAEYRRVVETGEPLRVERPYPFEPGSSDTWFEVSAVKNGDGLIITYLDITDRRRADEEIRNNLTILQQAEDLAEIGSWAYNQTTGQFTWSEGMYRLFGPEPDRHASPETYLERAIEADLPIAQRLVDFIRQGVGAFDEVLRIRSADGVKTLRIKATTTEGTPAQVLGVDVDSTEQLRAQVQIRQTADYLQAVLNNEPASVGYLRAVYDKPDELEGDPDTDPIRYFRLVVCNDKFAQLVGLPQHELIGQSAERLATLLWGEATSQRLNDLIRSGEFIYEERQQVTNGEDRWLGLSINRYDGGVVLIGLDITAIKQAELQHTSLLLQLEGSQQTLEALTQIRQQVHDRGEFLRQTSHDLRGSLGVIQGAAQLLDIVKTEEERLQMLSMLQRNLRQMTQLLTELMDYARLEAVEETITLTRFDVAELLRGLCDSVQLLADERGLSIRTEGPGSLLVTSDAVVVRRIAQNLVLNALKYTKLGSVTVGWQATTDGWYLTVNDTGPGLSAAMLQRLTTDPNEELPSGAEVGKYMGDGEGVGLFIVSRLVGLLGARLSVESEAGTGTRFRIRFSEPKTD